MQKKFYISPIFFKEAKFELNVFKRATQLTLNSPEFNYPAHKYQTRDATRKGAKGESEVEVSRRGRYPFSKRVEFSSDQLARIRANYSKVRLHFHPVFGGQLRHFPHLLFPLSRFFLLPLFHLILRISSRVEQRFIKILEDRWRGWPVIYIGAGGYAVD